MPETKCIQIAGYTRKDGTRVKAHERCFEVEEATPEQAEKIAKVREALNGRKAGPEGDGVVVENHLQKNLEEQLSIPEEHSSLTEIRNKVAEDLQFYTDREGFLEWQLERGEGSIDEIIKESIQVEDKILEKAEELDKIDAKIQEVTDRYDYHAGSDPNNLEETSFSPNEKLLLIQARADVQALKETGHLPEHYTEKDVLNLAGGLIDIETDLKKQIDDRYAQMKSSDIHESIDRIFEYKDISISEYDQDRIIVTVTSDALTYTRVINTKEKTIYNDLMLITDGFYKGYGIGSKHFINQAESAAKEGYKAIHASLERADGLRASNGYYTFARLGYQPPKDFLLSITKGTQYEGLPLYKILATKDGRNWWREKGDSFKGRFDLHENSISMLTLREYAKAKGIKIH